MTQLHLLLHMFISTALEVSMLLQSFRITMLANMYMCNT